MDVAGDLVAQGGDLVGDPHIGVMEGLEVVGAGGEIVVAGRIEQHGHVVGSVALVDRDQPLVELLDRHPVLPAELVELALGRIELCRQLMRASLRRLDLGIEHHRVRSGLVGLRGQRGDLRRLRVDPVGQLPGIGASRVDLVLQGGILGAGEGDAQCRRRGDGDDRPERHAPSAECPAGPDACTACECGRCFHLLRCLRG